MFIEEIIKIIKEIFNIFFKVKRKLGLGGFIGEL